MFSKFIILTIVSILAIVQLRAVKSWSRPADWYCIWSMALITISVLFIYPNYEWEVTGIAWWILSCICCLIGSISGSRYVIKYPSKSISNFWWRALKYENIIKVYYFMAIMYSVLLLANHGFSLLSIRSAADLYRINNYMQGYRYSNLDTNEGLAQQICLSFTYALPICGGLLINQKKGKLHSIKCFLCLLPNFLITILNNTKSGIIIAIILFVSSYIIGYMLINKKEIKLSPKFIRGVVIGLCAFLVFVFWAIRLRYNSDASRSGTDYIISALKDYIFGCTVNFDHYFSGIKSMDLSQSYDFLAGSNILTANTFWIYKYGYIGTLFIWFIRGFFSGSAYQHLKNGSDSIIEIVVLLYVYLNAIYFFTYIPFSYTTVCIGVFVLFPVFFSVFRRQYNNR